MKISQAEARRLKRRVRELEHDQIRQRTYDCPLAAFDEAVKFFQEDV